MNEPLDWLKNLHPLLRVEARMLRLDPRLRKRFDSSDLANETMLKAQQNIADFRGTTPAEMWRWAQQILHNQLRDLIEHERAQKRDVAREQSLNAAMAESSARLESILASAVAPPEEQVERQDFLSRLAALLDGALEQLPEAQRDALILNKLQGVPVKEIAPRLGRTEKAVRMLLARGMNRLREMPELRHLFEESP